MALWQITTNIVLNNSIKQVLITNYILTMETLIDYRNAKYQGQTNNQLTRNGFGILIDDDLSFYASSWNDGKLNDATLIYISHGKYIYGLWHNNQPHGLNVFRIGDTVVLGEFDNGYLVKKLNFVAILQQIGRQWTVRERGVLKNYNQLVTYIQQAKIPMKPQYFSLTKFLTFMSNQKVMPIPCTGSQNCYYGFTQGLGIVFNSNNGVVTVGHHQNKYLTEFGGKYQSFHTVTQGNFLTNEVIKYSKQRPKQQIYSIFQKLHKRSLNFKNQYFDSKVKLLTHIQQLVRGKIDQIANKRNENIFTANDLNDSLDYHCQNLQEIDKIYRIRQQVYQAAYIPMKKTISQYTDGSPKLLQKRSTPMTPSKRNLQLITNAPASPIIMKKSPYKQKQMQKTKQRQKQKDRQSEKNKQLSRTPTKKQLNISHVNQRLQKFEEQYQYSKQSPLFTKKQSIQTQIPISKSIKNSAVKRLQQLYSQSSHKHKDLNQKSFQQVHLPNQQPLISSKNYIREKQLYDVPSFKYSQSCTQKPYKQKYQNVQTEIQKVIRTTQKAGIINQVGNRIQNIQNVQWIQTSGQSNSNYSNSSKQIRKQNQTSLSPIKGPNYQNLSERRKRLLKQFKNLNRDTQNPGSAISKLLPNNATMYKPILQSSSIKIPSNQQILRQNTVGYNYAELQSPCARLNFPVYESKDTEQNDNMLPLTISKQKNYNITPTKNQNQRQKQLKYFHKQPNNLNYKFQYNGSQMNYKQNIEKSVPVYQMSSSDKSNYYLKTPKNQKMSSQIKFDENRLQNNSVTPNGRKTYKYCFE